MTSFIYMLPLGGKSLRKPWGASDRGFPCCWGTLSEQFSKLADSVFFRAPSDDALYVNLFLSSELRWPARGVAVSQDASAFPASHTSTTTLTVSRTVAAASRGGGGGGGGNTTFTLYVRCPAWATTGGNTIA